MERLSGEKQPYVRFSNPSVVSCRCAFFARSHSHTVLLPSLDSVYAIHLPSGDGQP